MPARSQAEIFSIQYYLQGKEVPTAKAIREMAEKLKTLEVGHAYLRATNDRPKINWKQKENRGKIAHDAKFFPKRNHRLWVS